MTIGEGMSIAIPITGLTFTLLGAAIGYGWRSGKLNTTVEQNRTMIERLEKSQKDYASTFHEALKDIIIAHERQTEKVLTRLDVSSEAMTKLKLEVADCTLKLVNMAERLQRVEKALNGALKNTP